MIDLASADKAANALTQETVPVFVGSSLDAVKNLQELSSLETELKACKKQIEPKLIRSNAKNLEEQIAERRAQLLSKIARERVSECLEKGNTKLDLSDLRLRALPEEIKQLVKVEILDIGNNQLESLPQSISDLPNLKYLKVAENPLKSLPESMGWLRKLEMLEIDRKQQLKTLFKKVEDNVYVDSCDRRYTFAPAPECIVMSFEMSKKFMQTVRLVPLGNKSVNEVVGDGYLF